MLGADGLPRPDIFVEDQLHMNRKGYELWAPIVRAVLVP
jgi:lysophospholipase L1-like esterase